MKKGFMLFIGIAGSTTPLLAAEPPHPLPEDVSAFIERRDLCDHFRGEDPYDAERRVFLNASMDEYCTGSDRALASLKEKYRDSTVVMERLSGYEEDIEPGQ